MIERAEERRRATGRADDLLPRRDPPLQQGPAGRAAARRRGGAGDADRRDDREPVLRGQLGAALALPDLRVPGRSTPAQIEALLRRALSDERGIADPPTIADDAIELLAARAGGDARAALAALERAVETARETGGSGRRRRGRGRAAAQGDPLRPRRRQALRLHLGLDQGDARLRPRRLALLPRGDARGRRGPALHRPADGDPRLRGRRQRRPAGARRRHRGRARPSTASGCRSASSTSPRPPPTWRWRRSRTPRRARSRAPRATSASTAPSSPPPYLQDAHYPGAKKLGRGEGYVYPHDEPGGVADQPLAPEGLEGERFYEPTDRGFEAELRRRLEEIRRRLGG